MTQTEQTLVPRLDEVIDIFNAGFYAQAVETAQKLSMSNPSAWPAYEIMGAAHMRLNDKNKSIECYKRVIELNPNRPTAHNALGIIYFKQNRYYDAASQFTQALRLKHEFTDAKYNLGETFWQLGKQQQAIECFRSVLSQEPTNDAALTSYKNAAKNFGTHNSQLFDKLADKYDSVIKFSQYIEGELTEVVNAVKNLGTDLENKQILDLGCGTGLFAQKMAANFKSLVGVDNSINMLGHAQEKKLYSELVHQDVLSYMSKKSKGVDIIVASSVIQFLNGDELGELCKHAARIMNDKDSRFLFSFDISEEPIKLNHNNLFEYSISVIENIVSNHLDIIELKKMGLGRFECGKFVDVGLVICSLKIQKI